MSAHASLIAAAGPGRLEAHFQPIVRLDDGAIAGFEALARWRGENGVVMDAVDFLPAANWTNEHAAIGRDAALLALNAFARRSRGAALSLSLNIIDTDLFDGGAERLLDTAEKLGLAKGALLFELTEHHTLPDLERAAAALAALRQRGARIALDDFGAGHSSLAWLAHLPIDAIKIDRTLVACAGEARGHTVLAFVLTLARDLGVATIAEGVETEAHARLLRELGCTMAQGRLFGMALPAEAAFAGLV